MTNAGRENLLTLGVLLLIVGLALLGAMVEQEVVAAQPASTDPCPTRPYRFQAQLVVQ